MSRSNCTSRQSPGRAWSSSFRKTRLVHDEGLAHYSVATRTSLGVTLVRVHRWTGRLLCQIDYPWSILEMLDPVLRRKIIMDFFKKPLPTGIPVGGTGKFPTPNCLAERSPTLGHFLCDECWPDGEARQRSTLVVFVEDGTFKACLSDKDSGTSLWASCKSFDDLLEALEARLTDDRPDWRKARKKGAKG